MQQSENIINAIISQPAAANVRIQENKQQPKQNAFKKQTKYCKRGTEKYTETAEKNRGKSNTASKPAIDTRQYIPARIKEEKDSLADETKCIPKRMPKTQQKHKTTTGDTALRKRNTGNDQLQRKTAPSIVYQLVIFYSIRQITTIRSIGIPIRHCSNTIHQKRFKCKQQ